jgi:hypothetical protein
MLHTFDLLGIILYIQKAFVKSAEMSKPVASGLLPGGNIFRSPGKKIRDVLDNMV